MTPQFIKTEGGEELVVLTRRAYDAMLAQLGDDTAEDRAVARMAEDYLIGVSAGGGASVPHWFAVCVAQHGSAAKAARKHCRASRKDVAERLGISQSRLASIERHEAELSEDQRRALATHTGIDVEWLR